MFLISSSLFIPIAPEDAEFRNEVAPCFRVFIKPFTLLFTVNAKQINNPETKKTLWFVFLFCYLSIKFNKQLLYKVPVH